MNKIGNFFLKYHIAICCWLCGLCTVLNAFTDNIPLTVSWGLCASIWLALAASKE